VHSASTQERVKWAGVDLAAHGVVV
jgi:hypothetical protein